jgi:hypothetical protein
MSVYKRGQTYWYEFAFAGSRIRESAKTNSKRLAEEAERKRRRDLELGINRITKAKEIPLFKIAAERLIQEKRTRRSRNTGELYKCALKPLVKVLGTKLVCDISPEDIHPYQTRRLAAGISARTVNIEVGALRAVLKAHRLWSPISDAVEMLRERKDVGRALDY